MRLVTRRSDLVAALQTVERAVSTRQTMPILSGVLLAAAEGQLRLYATDLELSIECRIPAQVEEEGSAVLDARYLHQIARRFPEDEVYIEKAAASGVVQVRSGLSRLSLHYQDPSDFPQLPPVESEYGFTINQKTLFTMIRSTLFATANDPGRPFLTGVLFEIDPGELRLVATDGNRLALNRHVWEEKENPPTGSFRAIVPERSLGELLRASVISAAGEEDNIQVTVRMDRRQVSFSWPSYQLVTRLIEGQFPNYRPVIPAHQRITVAVPREALLAAVERAAVLSRSGAAFTSLMLENGVLRLRSREAEVGQVEEEIPVTYEESPFETAYQARFLTDVLRVLSSEEVLLGLDASLSPGTIRPAGQDNYVYVMMPVRVG
ncbi:MAG: DNA polymerase III subunit beta [Limnochordales bacterium]|nr:DNA polymerase III subunit beta [Limnochordales bacterium]